MQSQEDINELAYWLSTTSTLLFLLQNTIKASNTPNMASLRTRTLPAPLFSGITHVSQFCVNKSFYNNMLVRKNYGIMSLLWKQGLYSSSFSKGISSGYSGMTELPSEKSKVEAKYPALLFKQHLTACVEKLYGMIRDNLKKEMGQFLNLCIQVYEWWWLGDQESDL